MPTLTIDFTAPQATRIAAAFKTALSVENFTMADYKQWVIDQTKHLVHQQEKRSAVAALPAPGTFDPT